MSSIPFGPPTVVNSNPMVVVDDPGVAEGVCLDTAPHQIPNGMGRYLQDVLLDTPGIVRQRGPVDTMGGTYPTFPDLPSNMRVIGLTSLTDPTGNGAYRVVLFGADYATGEVHAVVFGRGAAAAQITFTARDFFDMPISSEEEAGNLGSGDPFIYIDGRRQASLTIGAQLADLTLPDLLIRSADNDPFFDSKPCLDGGLLIGIGENYNSDAAASQHRAMFHWRGAAKDDYTHDVTVTVNSKTVTGAGTTFQSDVEAGMFLCDSTGRLLGVVKSVESDTSLTLERNVLSTSGTKSSAVFKSFHRPFVNTGLVVNAGAITCSTSSATVNGGNTKFTDQGVANGDLVFRASDYTYIGTVSGTPASNTQLTLGANAAVALSNEDYVITRSAPWSTGHEPVFSAYWNGIQLVANADNRREDSSERSRIFVLGPDSIDSVDVTKTGTWYDLPSVKPHTDIRGLMPTESSCLVFLAEETYGLFGNTPEELVPRPIIQDDGCLSPMCVQPWQGGAVWAGHKGVYFFDGANAHDLLQGRAQQAHRKALANLDYSKYRAWAMIHAGHYVCFIQRVNTGVFDYTQGSQINSPSSIVYAINLSTGALVFWTNVEVRGYTSPPGTLVDERQSYYVIQSTETTGPAICSADSLFADEFDLSKYTDDVLATSSGVSYAPHVFVETRRSAFGDPERLKLFKQLQLQYLLYGESTDVKLGIDTVVGLSGDTTALTPKDRTTTSLSRVWRNVRTRFLKRATHVGFRFYITNSATPSIVRIGPWAVGMKLQRVGRV